MFRIPYSTVKVTSPAHCPNESPYIPAGFNDDRAVTTWSKDGEAWKNCYDGYRCEAWWGTIAGSSETELLVLDAPLDWPDCCALCNKKSEDGDDADGATCAAWSFKPSTGSCELLSGVTSVNVSSSWGVHDTIHGYPGYFEGPKTGCWSRGNSGLCKNMNMFLLIPGAILASIGLLCIFFSWFRYIRKEENLVRNLIGNPESSQLAKAICMKVTGTNIVPKTGIGGLFVACRFEGTFMTREGSFFAIPHEPERVGNSTPGRRMEQNMLSSLFSTNLLPLAGSSAATRCDTPEGKRETFSLLLDRFSWHPVRGRRETRRPYLQRFTPDRFDCLLLLSEERGMAPKV